MNIPLATGIILLAGAGGGKLARLLKLPSVTGNIMAGLLIGPSVLGLVDRDILNQLAPVNELALGVIAISIGAELRWGNLKSLAKTAFKIFAVESLVTFAIVFIGLLILGLPVSMALIFGVLSIATAPGAIIACIRETNGKSQFGKLLLTIVAFDNLAAIIAFGILVSFMQTGAAITGISGAMPLVLSLLNVGISIGLGLIAGAFLIVTSKWARNDTRILTSVVGGILITVGLANVLDVPALLANIVAGVVYVNFSSAHRRISKALFSVEGLILVAFLTIAGAKLDIEALPAAGLTGIIYIAGRFIGKIGGSRIGMELTEFPENWKKNMGKSLTPQAGVAIGLAIIAEQKLVFAEQSIITVVLAAVVVFEAVGPLMLKKALQTCETENRR